MRKRHYACGCAECARLDLAFVGEGIQLGLPLPPPQHPAAVIAPVSNS